MSVFLIAQILGSSDPNGIASSHQIHPPQKHYGTETCRKPRVSTDTSVALCMLHRVAVCMCTTPCKAMTQAKAPQLRKAINLRTQSRAMVLIVQLNFSITSNVRRVAQRSGTLNMLSKRSSVGIPQLDMMQKHFVQQP